MLNLKINLKTLSDIELLKSTKIAASNERIATTVLLQHLAEVEARKLYAVSGRSSLYNYCIKDLKMSEARTGVCVNGARALIEFPEIKEQIISGDLSLTALNQAQVFFNQEARMKHLFSSLEKKAIISEISQLSTRKAEKVLINKSVIPKKVRKEKVKQVTSEYTEVRVSLDEETMQGLDRLKEVWSHQMPGASYAELIKKMAKICLYQHDPMNKAKRAKVREEKELKAKAQDTKRGASRAPDLYENKSAHSKTNLSSNIRANSDVKTNSKLKANHANRYIPAIVKHEVWERDKGRCTYHENGTQCDSKHHIQLDHVIPFAMGGVHHPDNLRLRCHTHNQLYARECFGSEKIEQYHK